jgi:hypothetical protein
VGYVGEGDKKIGRRDFLKLGLAGVSGAVLFLLSGCVAEGGEDDDDDDGSGRRRRRRRRR